MTGSTRKRQHSESPTNPTPSTSSKKSRKNSRVTPVKGKSVPYVYRAIAGSSRTLAVNSRPNPIDYPPLDQFWLVFGDNASSQYLKTAATRIIAGL